jgi:hypothetical protein
VLTHPGGGQNLGYTLEGTQPSCTNGQFSGAITCTEVSRAQWHGVDHTAHRTRHSAVELLSGC